jgi:predicted GNAT family acetyltransferase
MTDPRIDVRDNPDLGRYDVLVDDEPAGFTAYRLRPGRVVFVHTEIADGYAGRGVGTALARGALDDVRRRGLQVTPLCPFIAGFLRRHPEYDDLVAEGDRARVRP